MNALKDLTQLIVADGQAYINFGSDLTTTRLDLQIAGSSVPFRPCDDTRVADLGAVEPVIFFDAHQIAAQSVSIPAESTPGERFACWVNKLADWALSGSQTLQLLIARRDEACEIRLGQPVKIEAGAAQSFNIALAAHRAKAVLNVDVTDIAEGETKRQRISFDSTYKGGTMLTGYQAVTVPLPASIGGQSIALSVEYQSYVADGVNIEPFLFLANAHIAPVVRTSTPNSIAPHVVISRSRPKPGGWFSAPFPAIPAIGGQLELTLDGRQLEVIPVPAISLNIRENYGHTLILSAAHAAELMLYIDGECVDRLHVTPGDTILRMPIQSLDGADHHIALKDASGSFTYLETVLLVPAIITPADVMRRETPPPFPDTIFAQTGRRYASLKQQIARGGVDTDFGQMSYALSILEGGYERVKLKPLRFVRPAEPDVSIIIPAHNKVEVTYLALCSLLVAYNEASFEVIVVDDASTDDTGRLEDIVSGITVIHNKEAMRFIRACNAGAEQAKGRYIVLLNNDVEVTSGWLDELIATFDRFERVGLAGSKLLYPDGKLQDAGGIIWGNGNPWNYGNGQNANAPCFSYARQADYLSGAALMIPGDLWRQIGGLSAYLEPMYFEDTDLSFKVREAGYSTWFVPSSVVYHYEGMTSGTDTSKGFKRFQEVNRPKFKRRWAKDYANFGQEGQRPDLEKDRGVIGRVLFIDYSTPRGDQDAGSYAALSEIRLVQSLGY
ncbi:glycosyltransferase family 2 protein, partial [Thioclava sp. BHET1]